MAWLMLAVISHPLSLIFFKNSYVNLAFFIPATSTVTLLKTALFLLRNPTSSIAFPGTQGKNGEGFNASTNVAAVYTQ
jgi:hypothetical protein